MEGIVTLTLALGVIVIPVDAGLVVYECDVAVRQGGAVADHVA